MLQLSRPWVDSRSLGEMVAIDSEVVAVMNLAGNADRPYDPSSRNLDPDYGRLASEARTKVMGVDPSPLTSISNAIWDVHRHVHMLEHGDDVANRRDLEPLADQQVRANVPSLEVLKAKSDRYRVVAIPPFPLLTSP